MNDLDTLRPEVMEAAAKLDDFDSAFGTGGRWQIIRAELLRLATIEADALIAIDCEHDWQVEHERAEKAEAELATAQNTINAQQDTMGALKRKLELSEGELAALKARIAEAPVVACPKTLVHAGNTMQTEFLEYTHERMPGGCNSWAGKRVRLVVEE